jgi:hypothetical protein
VIYEPQPHLDGKHVVFGKVRPFVSLVCCVRLPPPVPLGLLL